jgi:Uncharacterised protein family (UPF0175)
MNLEALPGGDLVQEGLADLARGVESVPALLVSIGAPRLRRIGLPVPASVIADPERRLYDLLAESDSDSAHSRYNALVRRLVSFENAAECALSAGTRSYSQGLMSQERAAMAAGLDRTDFLMALARAKVDAFPVDLDELAREISRE